MNLLSISGLFICILDFGILTMVPPTSAAGDPAVCENSPCQNGGRCLWRHIAGIPFKHGYYCRCKDWNIYSGPRCNIYRACLNNPCPGPDEQCFPSSQEPGRYCTRKSNRIST